MSKIVKLEGRTLSVPDDATPDEIDALFGGTTATPAQPAGGGDGNNTRDMSPLGVAANQTVNVLEGMGVDPSSPVVGTARNIGKGLWGSLKGIWDAPVSGTANAVKDVVTAPFTSAYDAVEGLASGDYERAARGAGTFAASTPVVAGGAKVASGASKSLFNAVRDRMPSKVRAGAKFQTVMDAAKDVPLNTADAGAAVARAQELKTRGSSMPKVLADFAKDRKAATGDFMGTPVELPMTYEVGRDFSSNAGALSAREITRMNAKTQAQVSKFAQAMKEANREAAVKAGVGELYDQAMKEYARAMSLEAKADIVKKFAVKAALGGGAAYVGYKVLADD